LARSPDTAARLARLSEVLAGARTLCIVTQNNPDPDAIAAAAALREIANELHGVACSVVHGGAVGRAENEALLRYLGLKTRPLEGLDLERFDRLAMVDAQPGAGNVGLDPGRRLDVVIDHHPIRRLTRSARFTDVRKHYGATSTILFEYLREAHLEIGPPLATALLYGIRSDTQDLGRETTRADIEAFLALYPIANQRVLGRIVSAPLPRAYFASLRQALDSAVIHGDRIVSFLREPQSAEMIAEAADLLLRAEGVRWSMCVGRVDGWLHLSLRTLSREKSAGEVARQLAGRKGQGGGHQALAAAQIPLPQGNDARRKTHRMVADLRRRFLRATGGTGPPGEPLCEHRHTR